MKWMEIAQSSIGIAEIAGDENNPAILDFFAAAGHPGIKADSVHWCAAFVGSCLEKAGIRCSRSLMARSYLDFGTPIDMPQYGAIAVFKRGAPPSGHVGFVTGWTETTIQVLGGNQGDAVSICTMARGELLGLRWPAPAKTPQEVEAAGSRIVKEARLQKTDSIISGGSGVAGGTAPAAPGGLSGMNDWVGNAGTLKGFVQTMADFGGFLWAKWPWVAAALALYFGARAIWRSDKIRRWRTEDENTGATTKTQEVAYAGTDAA